jgi:hypothetical protein
MGSGLPDERLGMHQVSKGNLRGNTFGGGLQKDVNRGARLLYMREEYDGE